MESKGHVAGAIQIGDEFRAVPLTNAGEFLCPNSELHGVHGFTDKASAVSEARRMLDAKPEGAK